MPRRVPASSGSVSNASNKKPAISILVGPACLSGDSKASLSGSSDDDRGASSVSPVPVSLLPSASPCSFGGGQRQPCREGRNRGWAGGYFEGATVSVRSVPVSCSFSLSRARPRAFAIGSGLRGERTGARLCGTVGGNREERGERRTEEWRQEEKRRREKEGERKVAGAVPARRVGEGERGGRSQSVPKTFTIARLGSLALAFSLGLCLMAYLPM